MHTDPNTGIHRADTKSLRRGASLLALTILLGSGCAMNETQQRTGTGAAIGALGGALIGTSRESAAIGAAVGAAGGYLFDRHQTNSATEAENERLRQENARLQQQSK